MSTFAGGANAIRIEPKGLRVSGTGCDNLRSAAESPGRRYSSGRVLGGTGTMAVNGDHNGPNDDTASRIIRRGRQEKDDLQRTRVRSVE